MTTDHSEHKNSKDSVHQKRSLFGRRQGRKLSGIRAELLETLLPTLEIPKEALKQDHSLNPKSLFKQDYGKFILEIGFGHGERLAKLSQSKPETAFIGAEPFITGVADCLQNIQNQPHNNIRLFPDDGILIARSLTPKSIDEIHVLNPDPWHKTRHHKRRIISQENLSTFTTILKPNGKLIMTSDVPDLSEWMCTQANNHPSFNWTATSQGDWQSPPNNWVKTRYEEKGAKGAKKMSYLIFEKTVG